MFLLLFICIVLFLWMSEKRPLIHKKRWCFTDDPNTIIPHGTILTSKTYKGYVTIPLTIATHPIFTVDPKRFHDLVCLWTLAEHGGVWRTPPKKIEEYDSTKEFHGYYTKTGIDTAYMECVKGSPFICAWRDEYSRMAQFSSVEHYVASRSVGTQQFTHMDPLQVAFVLVLSIHHTNIELRSS